MTSGNRNFILEQAIENKQDAVLWLDTDMVYPPDILVNLINSKVDICGSVYFKRSEPFDPCVYVDSENPFKPYKIVDIHKLPLNTVVEVDGLGFGGLFVKMSVYDSMGENKWMRYGKNFGIPGEKEDQLSHDLVFCRTAKKYGHKIYVHSGVKCGHIGEKIVTIDDWDQKKEAEMGKKIAVIIPSIDVEKAQKTVEQLKKRAEFPAEYYIIEDKERTGYIQTINNAIKNIDADFYVYTAEDAYAGIGWLKIAYECIERLNGGLFAFNDGKNMGTLATFGMVRKDWLETIYEYEGNLFYKGYKSHYGDTELSIVARQQKKLVTAMESVLMEVDYNKHGVNVDDKKLYNERKLKGFDGLVKDPELINMFS